MVHHQLRSLIVRPDSSFRSLVVRFQGSAARASIVRLELYNFIHDRRKFGVDQYHPVALRCDFESVGCHVAAQTRPLDSAARRLDSATRRADSPGRPLQWVRDDLARRGNISPAQVAFWRSTLNPSTRNFPLSPAQEIVSTAQIGFATAQVDFSRAKKPSREPYL